MLQVEAKPAAVPVHTTIASKLPPLSGEAFGALINLSGRRRFTSQRLVLYAVLASLGHDGAMHAARDTLKLFREAHQILAHGSDDLPGVFCESLRHAYYGNMEADKQIREFISLAQRTLDAIESEARHASMLLEELIQRATPLLAIANHLTMLYETEARRHSHSLKKQRADLMTDIERIARLARMVAFNAQVVAARAGAAGREFSVVAGELSAITGELDELVHAALDRE